MPKPEQLCDDVLCSLFFPYVRAAAEQFFCNYLTVKPKLEVYCVKLVTLRYSPCDPPAYLLEFDACPYLGAHITLAVLRVTLRVGRFDGSIQTVECRLLRSFPVPPHLRDFVKQPF